MGIRDRERVPEIEIDLIKKLGDGWRKKNKRKEMEIEANWFSWFLEQICGVTCNIERKIGKGQISWGSETKYRGSWITIDIVESGADRRGD
jgi:hypothetical protein